MLAIKPTPYRVNFRYIGGDAILAGGLRVTSTDGFAPQVGDSFEIMTAGEGISGGFSRRSGLVVGDVSLYPVFGDTTVTLTAVSGVPTISGTASVLPAEVVGDAVRNVVVSGTGFGPDVAVRLACVACQGATDDVPGLVRSISSSELDVAFDLRDGSRLGTYELIVSDPRGGEARMPFGISPGPPVLRVAVVEPVAFEEGNRSGSILISSSRPLLQPLTVSFSLGGSATQYVDYLTNLIGESFVLEADRDSFYVTVFPLTDSEAEAVESVSLQLQYTGPIDGSSFASVQIEDGPPSEQFSVFSANPASGGNLGAVTVNVYGQGFDEGASVQLAGAGDPIDALEASVNQAGTILTATFLLSNAEIGTRDIVVSSGGDQATLPDAFEIEPAIYPDVFVQVLAPPRVPRTRERTYTVLLRNRGNVDVRGHAALAGLPPDVDWRIDDDLVEFAPGDNRTWSDFAPAVEEEGVNIITLPEITLSAGETRRINVYTAVGTPQTLTLIGAWKNNR